VNKQLLVVYHSRSGSTGTLADAAIAGARDPAIERVTVTVRSPFDITATDVRQADGLLLGTPENFGYMSGALKHFFDSIYYDCLEHTQGLPYALLIKAGNDGQGALSAIQRIVTGLRWRLVAPPVIAVGELTEAHVAAAYELGMTVAAGLEAGLF
jgi:multimeric flavodoxin WrbA